MSWLPVLPIILPFAAAAATLKFRTTEGTQHWIAIGFAFIHLAFCLTLLTTVVTKGMISTQIGDWPAPFGITLAADHLSAIMVAVTGILAFSVTVYSKSEISKPMLEAGYYPLLQIMIGAVCGAFLTGDLFNLYVWFEVMLMASFGLIVLGQEKEQLDGGVKYVTLNLFATLLFIMGLGLLYGITGTLNLADLHLKVQETTHPGLLTTVSIIFMFAFGIKAGMFPLFFWLPASYHTPPVAVSTILSGLLTKVGVYALIRMFTLVFTTDIAYTHGILLAAAGVTMIAGVLGAAANNEIRRILSFHIISQIGYIVMGLALFTPLALSGAIFFLAHNMIVKPNLFLISGVSRHLGGSFDLDRLGGLYSSRGFLALLFFIPAFSLAGFPPLSGFWGKLTLIRAGLENSSFIIAGIAAGTGVLTTYSMTKIWGKAFWKPAPGTVGAQAAEQKKSISYTMLLPIVALTLLTLIIGLVPGPFFQMTMDAAHELMHPEIYVNTVMGGK